jgi:hypothetical protein
MGYLSCSRHRTGVGRTHGGTADKCKDRGIATAFVIPVHGLVGWEHCVWRIECILLSCFA